MLGLAARGWRLALRSLPLLAGAASSVSNATASEDDAKKRRYIELTAHMLLNKRDKLTTAQMWRKIDGIELDATPASAVKFLSGACQPVEMVEALAQSGIQSNRLSVGDCGHLCLTFGQTNPTGKLFCSRPTECAFRVNDVVEDEALLELYKGPTDVLAILARLPNGRFSAASTSLACACTACSKDARGYKCDELALSESILANVCGGCVFVPVRRPAATTEQIWQGETALLGKLADGAARSFADHEVQRRATSGFSEAKPASKLARSTAKGAASLAPARAPPSTGAADQVQWFAPNALLGLANINPADVCVAQRGNLGIAAYPHVRMAEAFAAASTGGAVCALQVVPKYAGLNPHAFASLEEYQRAAFDKATVQGVPTVHPYMRFNGLCDGRSCKDKKSCSRCVGQVPKLLEALIKPDYTNIVDYALRAQPDLFLARARLAVARADARQPAASRPDVSARARAAAPA
jgi:hypothetical protein